MRLLLQCCFLLGLVGLTGCLPAVVDETGPLNVTSVTVTTAPDIGSVTDIGPAMQAAASGAVVGVDPRGTPSTVHVDVEAVLYKNAVLSALVGSGSAIESQVTVADASGQVLESRPVVVVHRDAAINGVLGAAVALLQDRELVDQQLVDAYAKELRKQIYGPEGHVPAVKTRPAKQKRPSDTLVRGSQGDATDGGSSTGAVPVS